MITGKITYLTVTDVRFPTSLDQHGSDAMHTDPDYSAAYVVIETDSDDGLKGHGLTFTLGKGTEVVVCAVKALSRLVIGKLLGDIVNNFRDFYRQLTSDGQLRWIGPEKGAVQLATAAVLNAVWDLWAKKENKPLWKLLVDMSPRQLLSCIDFRYITDVLTEEEAFEILQKGKEDQKARVLTKGQHSIIEDLNTVSETLFGSIWDRYEIWSHYQTDRNRGQSSLYRYMENPAPLDEVGLVFPYTDRRLALFVIHPDRLAALRGGIAMYGKEEHMVKSGYPAYTTSCAWLGYSDKLLKELCSDALKDGWTRFKVKVGADLKDDIRRCELIRHMIGPDKQMMLDANQRWDVNDAIKWVKELAVFKPLWIEEPTSPDDILGHATISKELAPLGIGVATGEQCHNRVMFKQFLQANALQYVQIDSCRLGSVNENLSVLLMAKKFNIPVCPHAGGVGLCELVQHLIIFDYISVSGSLEKRMCEYVDHLHEHFKHPVIIKSAAYMPPKDPGYSTEMKEESVLQYQFPEGAVWQKLILEKKVEI